MKTIDEQQAQEELNNTASKVTDIDRQRVLNEQAEIERKFGGSGPLSRFVGDVRTLFSLLRDYGSGAYRQVPWITIAAAVAALLYVLNPMDLVPDVIPVLGQLDDALVVSVCLKAIRKDLVNYKEWKKAQVASSISGGAL